MTGWLVIKGTDKTDMMISVDKIQYISETATGCTICLDNGIFIKSCAKFKDVENATCKMDGKGDDHGV